MDQGRIKAPRARGPRGRKKRQKRKVSQLSVKPFIIVRIPCSHLHAELGVKLREPDNRWGFHPIEPTAAMFP